MKKPLAKKTHAPKRRRRVHHPNPTHTMPPGALNDITETMAGMALVDMVRKMGISPIQVLLTVRSLAGNKRPTSSSNCSCNGECLCHTGVQLCSVPCPPDCPSIGTRFDGCHRCDCGKKDN
jgi:hypothetical protein